MKGAAVLLSLGLVAAVLVACGDEDSSSSPTGTGGEATNGAAADRGEATGGTGNATGEKGEATDGGVVHGDPIPIEADPTGGLAYTTDRVTVKAGNVSLEFNNPQATSHDVVIEDSSGGEVGRTQALSEGFESITITDVGPGEYTFYCSVPGHRDAGMEGTLTVKRRGG